MVKIVGTLMTLVLVFGTGLSAQAQTGERVLDTLTDLLRGGGQQVEGHVVAVHEVELILQSMDSRILRISTKNVDPNQLGRLHPGKKVRVTLRRGDQALAAAAIEPLSGDQRSFRTTTGVVESASGDRAQIRTSDGMVSVELSRFAGSKPVLRQGDQVTVTYDASGQTRTAVWVDERAAFGAASPSTAPTPGATGGGYERIHGFVEAIGLGTLTLKADDGRTVTVDTSRTQGTAADVRPGDLVNVTGRSTGDRFVAEVVQRQ